PGPCALHPRHAARLHLRRAPRLALAAVPQRRPDALRHRPAVRRVSLRRLAVTDPAVLPGPGPWLPRLPDAKPGRARRHAHALQRRGGLVLFLVTVAVPAFTRLPTRVQWGRFCLSAPTPRGLSRLSTCEVLAVRYPLFLSRLLVRTGIARVLP